jgi:hypothetical protein
MIRVAFVSDVDVGTRDTFDLSRSQRLLWCTGLGRPGIRTVLERSPFDPAMDGLHYRHRLAKLRKSITDHVSSN